MKFLRKTYWYTTAYLQKHGMLILGAVFIGAVLFSVLFRVFVAAIRLKQTKFIGRVGGITLATLPRDIQEKISNGLTTVDDTGTPQPSLADRWIVEDDGKTYRFVLNKNVKWQDGRLLQPEDVAYNFTDVQIVTTQNDVVFKLKEPFAPFPVVVSQPLFREVRKRKYLLFPETTIIGTGEYKITKIRQEGGTISELDLESVSDRLTYRFYPTESRAILAFKRGEVDMLEHMTTQDDFSSWKDVQVVPELRLNQYLGIFFNNNDPLFDKPIRQALNYAVPKIQGVERAETPLDPRSWAYNKTVKEYQLDRGNAIRLLLRAVPTQKMQFELSTVPSFQKEAEEIKQLWEELGIDAAKACAQSKDVVQKADCPNLEMAVQLRIVNVPDTKNFHALLIAQQSPEDPDQYYLWHSTQQTNFTGYRNPHVDKLLEDGRKTVDMKERRDIYLDFQQFLIEDSPAIFLRHLTWYTIER